MPKLQQIAANFKMPQISKGRFIPNFILLFSSAFLLLSQCFTVWSPRFFPTFAHSCAGQTEIYLFGNSTSSALRRRSMLPSFFLWPSISVGRGRPVVNFQQTHVGRHSVLPGCPQLIGAFPSTTKLALAFTLYANSISRLYLYYK